jgi:hypothetical protein
MTRAVRSVARSGLSGYGHRYPFGLLARPEGGELVEANPGWSTAVVSKSVSKINPAGHSLLWAPTPCL